MRIIDLLNKIANGEEVPKEIIYDNSKYFWCSPCKIYERVEDGSKDLYNDLGSLNDEVEILDDEEKRLPEKLLFEEGKISDKEFLAKYITYNRKAINEIIDYLKSKGDE